MMLDSGLVDEHARFTQSMLITNGNAPDLPLHERFLHLFISHFFQPIGLKHTTMRHIDYWFMHHVQAINKINLPTLIFQDLIKVIRGNIKTIPYDMHLSYLIRKAGCNVKVDPSLQ